MTTTETDIPVCVQRVIEGKAEPTPGVPTPGLNGQPSSGMRYLGHWYVPLGTQDVYDWPETPAENCGCGHHKAAA